MSGLQQQLPRTVAFATVFSGSAMRGRHSEQKIFSTKTASFTRRDGAPPALGTLPAIPAA
jgi:hypothetical protein